MREVTAQDCEMVSGGFGPVGAVIGGVSGGAAYIGESIGSQSDGSNGKFIGAVVSGALAGALLGPAGATALQIGAAAILVPQVGFYGGMAGGAVAAQIK